MLQLGASLRSCIACDRQPVISLLIENRARELRATTAVREGAVTRPPKDRAIEWA